MDDNDADALFLRIDDGFMTVLCVKCPSLRYMVFISKIPEAMGNSDQDTPERNEPADKHGRNSIRSVQKRGNYIWIYHFIPPNCFFLFSKSWQTLFF